MLVGNGLIYQFGFGTIQDQAGRAITYTPLRVKGVASAPYVAA